MLGFKSQTQPRRMATDAAQQLENYTMSEEPRDEQPETYWANPVNMEKYPVLAQAALTVYSVPGNGDVVLVCETSFSRLTLTTTHLRRSMLAATVERKTLLSLNWDGGWWAPNPELKDDPKMLEIFWAVSRSGVSHKRKRGEAADAAAQKEEDEARQAAADAKAAFSGVDLMDDDDDDEKEEGEI